MSDAIMGDGYWIQFQVIPSIKLVIDIAVRRLSRRHKNLVSGATTRCVWDAYYPVSIT